MKEAALSAAALMGLMGFAAYYNQQTGSPRAKRDVVEIEEFDVPIGQNVSDFDNPTEEDLFRLLEELEWVGEDNHFKGDEQDVKNFAAVRVNFKRIAKNKFGNSDWNAAFKAAHRKRYNSLANFVDFNEYTYPQAASLVEADEDGVVAGSGAYNGFDKTHPKVANILQQETISDTIALDSHFRDGNSIIGFIIPNTVPLNSGINENLNDFGQFWQFVETFKPKLDKYTGRSTSLLTPKIIIGRNSNKVAWQSRSPSRYDKRRYPWKRYAAYNARPAMQGMQPYIVRTALDIRSMIAAHAASPSADKDCFFMWIHQEIGADLNQLLLPETQELLGDLYNLCTIVNIFVGFDSYDPVIQAYATSLNPGLQTKAPLDNDYAGFYIFRDYAELQSSAFQGHLSNYMAIVKHRAGCRCTDAVYQAPVTEPPPTGVAGDLTALPGTEAPTGASLDEFDRELTEATPTIAGVSEGATGEPRVSVLDSCCGADPFAGSAYDSELRTCCEDGSVKTWSADGSDPCGF